MNEEIIIKQTEIIESLVWLNKKILYLLSQYTNIEEYEHEISQITQGSDIEI